MPSATHATDLIVRTPRDPTHKCELAVPEVPTWQLCLHWERPGAAGSLPPESRRRPARVTEASSVQVEEIRL